MPRIAIIAVILAFSTAPALALEDRDKPHPCYPSGMCSGDPERASLPGEAIAQVPTFNPPRGGAPKETRGGVNRLYAA